MASEAATAAAARAAAEHAARPRPFGYLGVTRPAWTTRWEAHLSDEASGERVFLGNFDAKESAARARTTRRRSSCTVLRPRAGSSTSTRTSTSARSRRCASARSSSSSRDSCGTATGASDNTAGTGACTRARMDCGRRGSPNRRNDASAESEGPSSRRANGAGFASSPPRGEKRRRDASGTKVSLGFAFERVVALPAEASAVSSRALSHPASAPRALASLATPNSKL